MTSLLESLGVMVHRRSRLALGMMVLCLLFATSASAAPGAPLQDRQRYVLTISGGVSLGAYEGGLLYYLMNHIGTRSPRSELAVVTGASAGSLNSLIAILSDCGLQREAPLDSLAYRVWQSVDLAGLAQPKDVTPISLFSRTAFSPAIAAIKQAWMGGIDTKCDVLLGVSVTRRTPIQHQIRPGLVVIRQAEYFVFRIQGRGKHQAPRISNAPPSDNAQAQLGLPFTGDDAGDFELLMQTLQASAAFPLAFKPQPLSYCVLTPQTGAGCARQNTATSEFIDGGVFDNTPLRLAESLARRRFPNKSDYNHLLFGVITAGGETHPDGAAASDQQQSLNQSPGLFSYLNELSRNLITTTRGREISTLLTEHPYLGDKLLINVHVLPPASHYYYAFSGFIDGGFREFDFALGMWEARFFVIVALTRQPSPSSLPSACVVSARRKVSGCCHLSIPHSIWCAPVAVPAGGRNLLSHHVECWPGNRSRLPPKQTNRIVSTSFAPCKGATIATAIATRLMVSSGCASVCSRSCTASRSSKPYMNRFLSLAVRRSCLIA